MMKLDGRKLKNARLDKGWTQEETAERCGIGPVTYNKAENGGSIHPSTARQITDTLGLILASVRIQIAEESETRA